MKEKVLEINNLKTYFYTQNGVIKAVDGACLKANKGEITAIVGESGSGKSVMSLSALRLIEKPGKIVSGEVIINNRNIMFLKEKDLKQIRGKEISMIFQDPMSSLNPTIKIKKQLVEIMKIHCKKIDKERNIEYIIDTLVKVGLKNPEQILESYPFQLSGGMCQRVMIAMALLPKPDILIADEPTTALDLTIQASILNELIRLKDSMAIVLITHDLGVVAQTADVVYVMKNGEIIEYGNVFDIFKKPQNSYTRELINAAK